MFRSEFVGFLCFIIVLLLIAWVAWNEIIGAIALLFALFLCVGMFIYYPLQFLPITAIGLVLYFAYKTNKKEKAKEKAQRQIEEETKRKQKEYESHQQAIRQRLLGFATESATIFYNIPEEINFTEKALTEAEREFADGAFAPFWDAVERAATHLARFDVSIQQILTFSNNYKSEIKKIDTTPPPFQLDINRLPDAVRTANRMRSIVRLAQKDFHFATIYEQRKTNQLLVKGFASLGQALSEMNYRIETSMNALSQSFSDSITSLAESNLENTQKLVSGVDSIREKFGDINKSIKESKKEIKK